MGVLGGMYPYNRMDDEPEHVCDMEEFQFLGWIELNSGLPVKTWLAKCPCGKQYACKEAFGTVSIKLVQNSEEDQEEERKHLAITEDFKPTSLREKWNDDGQIAVDREYWERTMKKLDRLRQDKIVCLSGLAAIFLIGLIHIIASVFSLIMH